MFLLVSHYHFGYKKDIAKRSVGKDASADAEKSMISKVTKGSCKETPVDSH